MLKYSEHGGLVCRCRVQPQWRVGGSQVGSMVLWPRGKCQPVRISGAWRISAPSRPWLLIRMEATSWSLASEPCMYSIWRQASPFGNMAHSLSHRVPGNQPQRKVGMPAGGDDGIGEGLALGEEKARHTLKGHEGPVRSVTAKDGGRWVLTAGSDRTTTSLGHHPGIQAGCGGFPQTRMLRRFRGVPGKWHSDPLNGDQGCERPAVEDRSIPIIAQPDNSTKAPDSTENHTRKQLSYAQAVGHFNQSVSYLTIFLATQPMRGTTGIGRNILPSWNCLSRLCHFHPQSLVELLAARWRCCWLLVSCSGRLVSFQCGRISRTSSNSVPM